MKRAGIKRPLLVVIASLASLAWIASGGMSAGASAPSAAQTNCEANAISLAQSHSAPENADGPIDFVCIPGVVAQAQSATAGKVTGAYDNHPAANNMAAVHAPDADEAICEDDESNPARTILDEHTEQIDMCVIYGQIDSPRHGTWERAMDTRMTIKLQSFTHQVDFRVNTENSDLQELSGRAVLQLQNGIFPPTDVGDELFALQGVLGTFSTTIYLNHSLADPLPQQTTNAIRFDQLAVFDSEMNFADDVDSTVTGERFLCPYDEEDGWDTCLFPNGEEAPVL